MQFAIHFNAYMASTASIVNVRPYFAIAESFLMLKLFILGYKCIHKDLKSEYALFRLADRPHQNRNDNAFVALVWENGS